MVLGRAARTVRDARRREQRGQQVGRPHVVDHRHLADFDEIAGHHRHPLVRHEHVAVPLRDAVALGVSEVPALGGLADPCVPPVDRFVVEANARCRIATDGDEVDDELEREPHRAPGAHLEMRLGLSGAGLLERRHCSRHASPVVRDDAHGELGRPDADLVAIAHRLRHGDRGVVDPGPGRAAEIADVHVLSGDGYFRMAPRNERILKRDGARRIASHDGRRRLHLDPAWRAFERHARRRRGVRERRADAAHGRGIDPRPAIRDGRAVVFLRSGLLHADGGQGREICQVDRVRALHLARCCGHHRCRPYLLWLLRELVLVEPGREIERGVEELAADLRDVCLDVDQALEGPAEPPHPRLALAEHQRTDQAIVLDADLPVRDASGPLRKVDDLLGALRCDRDVADTRAIEVVETGRHVVRARRVLFGAALDGGRDDTRLHPRGLPELEQLALERCAVAGRVDVGHARPHLVVDLDAAVLRERDARALEELGVDDDADRDADELARDTLTGLEDHAAHAALRPGHRRDDLVAHADLDVRRT